MTLQEFNRLNNEKLTEELSRCCGSSEWVEKMIASFPFSNKEELLNQAEKIWFSLDEGDWREAFEHHPKIGDITSLKQKFANTAQWAEGEQSAVKQTSDDTLRELAKDNKHYEDNFGYIFIVCATGKSAEEMLTILKSRLHNHPKDEIKIAAAEQNKITLLRLNRLLAEEN